MTKKEMRRQKKQRDHEMQDKLDNLNDDFNAIESVVKRRQNKNEDSEQPKAAEHKLEKSLQEKKVPKFS
jgi:hypothetical protein